MRRRGAYGEIFAEGFLEHVAGKLASAIIIVMDIEYVEAESAPEKERQVEIAIAEVVGGGEVEFGQTIAYDCAVSSASAIWIISPSLSYTIHSPASFIPA